MPDGSLLKMIIMVVCIIFSGFFSATETAFTSFNHTKMKNLATDGTRKEKRKAKLVLKLADKYDKLLSTILIGNNIVNITLSSVATVWFIQLLMNTDAESYGSAIATAVTTVVVLIFGEISPKSIAKEHPEGFAMAVCRLVNFFVLILTPINAIFMLWKKFLNLIFKPAEEEAVTEGEVLTLLDEAHEDGSIDEYNKEMIENIFDFDDLSAGEIATHRTELTMLAAEDSPEEWENVIYNSRFSRYPVYGENVDDIVGVLDAREYFRLEDKTKESIMEHAVKPAYFVPENVKADVLLRNMKANKASVAIVLDEYGGVRGLVTFTDLVECLVGELTESDEDEEQIESIVRLDDNRWQINGSVTISDLEGALEVEISDCDSDTFNGLAMGLYGSIPEDGSTFSVSNDLLDIEVLDIREHRIESAIITLKAPIEDDDEDEDKEEKSRSSKSESVL